MAENIYDSGDNMTATISRKSKSDLFCLLLQVTWNQELFYKSRRSKKIDLQIKAFQKKLILQSSCSASKKLGAKNCLDNDRNSSLLSICNFTNAWIPFQVFLVSASEDPN